MMTLMDFHVKKICILLCIIKLKEIFTISKISKKKVVNSCFDSDRDRNIPLSGCPVDSNGILIFYNGICFSGTRREIGA